MLRKIATVLTDASGVVWSALMLLVGLGILLAIGVYLSRHVSCVNLFDKVCLVY